MPSVGDLGRGLERGGLEEPPAAQAVQSVQGARCYSKVVILCVLRQELGWRGIEQVKGQFVLRS